MSDPTDDRDGWRTRAEQAEARAAELEALLREALNAEGRACKDPREHLLYLQHLRDRITEALRDTEGGSDA